VFPDYCSSGVWINGGHNADPETLGISPGLQLALQYWHEAWEFNIGGQFEMDWDPEKPTRVSKDYIQRWKKDGYKLCNLMSAENDKYRFAASF
jgi:hypothetical protein